MPSAAVPLSWSVKLSSEGSGESVKTNCWTLSGCASSTILIDVALADADATSATASASTMTNATRTPCDLMPLVEDERAGDVLVGRDGDVPHRGAVIAGCG